MDRSECCRCSQRKKERSPEEYKKLIHRLNRIEGQIRGIRIQGIFQLLFVPAKQ